MKDSEPPENATIDAEHVWRALDGIETNATRQLKPELAPLEPLFSKIYTSAAQATTLPSLTKRAGDVEIIAYFLKRTLNDFRCVWKLLNDGYTSQAAAIAASLCEYALTCEALAMKPSRVRKIQLTKSGDLPWSVAALAKMIARGRSSSPKNADGMESKGISEGSWRAIYSQYQYLCKIKHPTMQTVAHDSGSTLTTDGWFIIALPDLRQVDLPNKTQIALIAMARLHCAVHEYAACLSPDTEHREYNEFAERMKSTESELHVIAKAVKLLIEKENQKKGIEVLKL